MVPIEEVLVTEGTLTLMWAFDLGAFVEGDPQKLRLARSDADWLDNLAQALRVRPDAGRLATSRAHVDTSQFERANERVGASTLSALQARRQMPLRVPAHNQGWAESGACYRWMFESVAIGPYGAATVRFRAELVSKLAVESVIAEYHQLIQLLRVELTAVVGEMLGLLTDVDLPLRKVAFLRPAPEELEPYLIGYESFDVRLEFVGKDGLPDPSPVKRHVENGELTAVRKLAALSRMTPTEPDHFDATRLRAFQIADVGNREDELWIVNSHRMLRSHPERMENRVAWFYADVLCIAELAVQQLANLEYTDHWLGSARSSLRQRMSSHSGDVVSTGEVLRSIEAVSDLIVQPHSLTIGVRHPFFRTVVDALIDQLGLRTTGEQVQRSADLFLNVASAVFSHDVSVSSQLAEQENADMTRSMKSYTRATLLATVVAVVVSAVALALGQRDDSSKAKAGDQPSVSTQTNSSTVRRP
jgi:hypothetical protein